MRFVFQIGDFYYLIQICSITFEFITIIFVSGSKLPTFILCLYIIFTFVFTLFFGNVLTIPLWEFFQLRWLKNKNPFQTILNILNPSCCTDYQNDTVFLIEKLVNFVCGIIFYIYLGFLISYMNGKGEEFDIMNGIVLLIFPGIKFFLIYLTYLAKIFIVFLECEKCLKNKNENGKHQISHENLLDNGINNINDVNQNDQIYQSTDNNKKEICDPFVISMIKKSEINCYFYIKLAFLIIWFIIIGVIDWYYHISGWGALLSLVIFAYVAIFSLFINMPIWFFNFFHQWDCKNIIKSREGKNVEIRKNRKFRGFKYISFIGQILPFFVIFVLIVFFIRDFKKDGTFFKKIDEDVHWDGQISGKFEYIPSITNVKSAMCYSKIYGLNLMQIASIAAAPYYSDLDNYIKLLYNSFFRNTSYIINMKFLRNDDNHAVIVQADFDTEDPNDALTIFSIRGSQTAYDWWLDIEMFVSSAMLSIAKWIPYLQRQEGYAARIITGFMTLPLSTMVKATMTYRYTEEMFYYINQFLNDETNNYRSVLFTGHSLGGGLSKVLANKYEIQSVSVSGPGITPIENKFRKSDDYDKYFKSKLIDIVPDRDIVPRFEVSGGTRHRVLCKKNVGQCHDKLRTICQMGVSCHDEYRVGDFCSNAFKDDYEQMRELAHF